MDKIKNEVQNKSDVNKTLSFDPSKRMDAVKETAIQGVSESIDPSKRMDTIDDMANKYASELQDKTSHLNLESKPSVDVNDWKKISPEENQKQKDEFNKSKSDLRDEWSKENGKEWPTYDKDVVGEKGNTIRKEGDKYDAHHIQPTSLGGKNEVSNIVPMHALDHYDHSGIHKAGSTLDTLKNVLGGN